ncbi:hypothetical protein BRARA_G02318 [Brassica rapa]|uniref:sucrose synthase n=1 Tax=Brassica campestris TaxID=3711 RepID=A0A397YW11_BRACM|nr:hypothetical protein BRARA_G02318 [Brassica rapa]
MASSSSPTTLQRSDSIADKMPDALKQSRYHMKRCFASFVKGGKKLMKRENLMNEIEKCIEDSNDRKKIMEGLFGYILTCTQEAAVVPPFVALAARPDPGFWEYVKVNAGDLSVDEITATDYLKLKESVFDESWLLNKSNMFFVQPALYEAFGLTVIEAMNCGLPTFATNQGGPAEIIVDGVSGFHIDPNNGDESVARIGDFFSKCSTDGLYWDTISKAGLKRIYECYTWKIYAEKLLKMGSIYGFWRQVNEDQKKAKQRYIDMLYNLQFKPLIKKVTIPEDKSLPMRLASLRNLLPKKPASLGGGSKQKEVTETKPKSKEGQERDDVKAGEGEVKEGLLAAEASERIKKVVETSEETQRLEKMKIAYGQQRNQGGSSVRNLFLSVVVCLYICYILKQRFFGTYSVQED